MGEICPRIAESEADASGRAEFHFNVPDDLGGLHHLCRIGRPKKTGRSRIKATALPLDVDRGPVGTDVPNSPQRLGWTETANICTSSTTTVTLAMRARSIAKVMSN